MSLEDAKVAEFMTLSPATISPQASMRDAVALARNRGVEHVAVVDNQSLIGFLCLERVAAADLDAPVTRHMRASGSIGASASVGRAMQLLFERDLCCVPVTAGGLLVGTLKRADLFALGLGNATNPCGAP